MRIRTIGRWLAMMAVLLASSQVHAWGWYRIVDHQGNTLYQTYDDAPWSQASFTAAGCQQVLVNSALVVQCSSGVNPYFSPFFSYSSTGARGCQNMTYPFIEQQGIEACFTGAYNVNTNKILPAGRERCPPGAISTVESPCVLPYVFEAAPTAPGGLVFREWIVAFGDAGFSGPTQPCEEPTGSTVCHVYPPADGVTRMTPHVTLVYGPPIQDYTGPLPGSGGATATATVSGGGDNCSFGRKAFIPVTDVPAPPPAGYSFPNGLFDFTLNQCTPGATVTVSITYPTPPAANMVYWKYGPTPTPSLDPVRDPNAGATPHWYQIPASVQGNTVSISITDGGLGDDDLKRDGSIIDQGGPGVPGANASAIPALGGWALPLLSGLLLLLAGGGYWRRRAG